MAPNPPSALQHPRLKHFGLTSGRASPPFFLFPPFVYPFAPQQGRAVKDVQSPIKIVGATKWCVFRTPEVTRQLVEEAVRERMDRMQSDRVDLLQVRARPLCKIFPSWPCAYRSAHIQFHWNDYSDPGYITALQLLQDLQREGLISALGLCNFDTIRMDEICTTLGPRSIVSNQIQVRSQ